MFRSALIGFALIATAAQAQANPAVASGAPLDQSRVTDQVVVTASPIDVIRTFVGKVAVATEEGTLARWDRKICPGVTGMETERAAFLNDRIAIAAYRLGLDVGELDCNPNIFIAFTTDGRALAQTLVDKNPDFMDKYDQTGQTAGRKALKEFIETPRPVRWWYAAKTMTADGIAVRQGEAVTVRSSGRLSRPVRQDFDRLLIVVDATEVGVVRFDALADYIAMVALAQLDPDAKLEGYTSILNIFADRKAGIEPAENLTPWDISYLEGLYGARRDALNANRQKTDIARRMQEGARPGE